VSKPTRTQTDNLVHAQGCLWTTSVC